MFSFDARFRMKLQERSLSVAFAGITKDQKLMPTGAISNSPLSVSDTGRFAALILPANDELSTLLSCGLRLMLVIILAARPLWIKVDASSCNRVGKLRGSAPAR